MDYWHRDNHIKKRTGYITFEAEDDDGYVEIKLRTKWVICWNCHGNETTVDPRIDGNGLSARDFDEDPDFRENYMSGRYDIICPECNGSGKTQEVDEGSWSEDGKTYLGGPNKLEDLKKYWKLCDSLSSYRAEVEAERRMGA